MALLDGKAIGLVGRQKNAVALEYDRSIVITTDIMKFNNENQKKYPPSIIMDNDLDLINVVAKDLILESSDSTSQSQSIVYGENLVELLKWMIKVLMTHKHPPNASPIPDFFPEANNRVRNMEVDLLNRRVKSR